MKPYEMPKAWVLTVEAEDILTASLGEVDGVPGVSDRP